MAERFTFKVQWMYEADPAMDPISSNTTCDQPVVKRIATRQVRIPNLPLIFSVFAYPGLSRWEGPCAVRLLGVALFDFWLPCPLRPLGLQKPCLSLEASQALGTSLVSGTGP